MPRDWDESDVRVRPNKRGTRPRTKDRPKYEDAQVGRVVAVDRGRYTVILDEGLPDERLVTAARARELHRQAIVVGDFVALVGDLRSSPDSLARLVRIEPRSTLLRRSADDTDPVERVVVANASQLVIVVAAMNPEPRTGFIDRALVAAYDAGITPIVLVTKTDLKDPRELRTHYELLGVPMIESRSGTSGDANSAHSLGLDSAAVEQLRELMSGEVTVLLGHSGVGKSTMVNALTGADRATGGVNAVTGRGRHTSSSAVALRLADAPAGSWIIDTPGIRSFGLALVDTNRIVQAFEDLVPAIEDCPRGCTHTASEPECALDEWVAQGHAGPSGPARLASFRSLADAVSSGRDRT